MATKDISINISPMGLAPVTVNNNTSTNPAVPQKGVQPSLFRTASATSLEDLKPDERVYGDISELPAMEAVEGIRFDFNDGIRVALPPNGKSWRIAFSDLDSGLFLYNNVVQPGGMVTSVKKFYTNFKLELFRPGESTPAFTHEFNCADKTVMVQMPVKTLGDAIAWFPYAERFRVKHNCKLVAVVHTPIKELLAAQYPETTFISIEETMKFRPYATYYLGLFFQGNTSHQPADFRYVGLHHTAGYILGVDTAEALPKFDLSKPRQIAEPYVCIAVQSSNQSKYWNNPLGWIELVKFLKNAGYRVLCMDRDPVSGYGINFNYMPAGAEDFTGNKPLQERVDIIKDADFFVGVSSGLSWLAWGCKVPVVMISGMTHPLNEFYTPYRVINYHVCNSCWNDAKVDFDHYDYLWCPRYKGTDRHFECSRMISTKMVLDKIKQIPAFQKHLDKQSKPAKAAKNK